MSLFDFFKREPKYIMTGDGNIALRWNGKTHSIGKTHHNYDAIVAVLLNKETSRLDSLLDPAVTIQESIEGVTVNDYGEVFLNGKQVHNVIADKISEFVRAKQPYKPLAKFLANLMQNPSERSQNELYNFLMHGGFPITHDGCFLAYKGIRSDWKDIHSNSFDNSIGSVNEMPRENVDPDSASACSTGFHVGTRDYAVNFGICGMVVLVKVNPRDAVSVPLDHDCQKLRVCRYEVVEVSERLIEEPLYPAVQPQNDGEDEQRCNECGEWELDCVCNEDAPCPECEEPECIGNCMDDYPIQVETSTGRARGAGGRFMSAR